MSQTLAERAARMLTVGFDGHLEPSDELKKLLDRGVGGVVFFGRNVGTPEEVFELTSKIKRHAGRPVFIGVDQEGGRVARLRRGFTQVPPMRAVGATKDKALAREVGQLLGRELRAVGFDVNFAPILDVDTNPDNPIIATRSLGRDAGLVSELGVELALGLQSVGVAACGKHFPGHGDTNQDSHEELPRLPHALERLNQIELPPFQAAVEAGIASIMTAHVIFEPLDNKYPATMSRPVLHGILREKMGFDGVIFTDDVEMKAIASHYGYDEAVIRGVNAGVDSFLCCHTPEVMNGAIDTIVKAVEEGKIQEQAVDAANRRLNRFVERFYRPAAETAELGVLACEQSRSLVNRILEQVDSSLADPGEDPTEIMEQIRVQQRLAKKNA